MSDEFEVSEGGLLIPKSEPVEDLVESEAKRPIKEDWFYSHCDDRRHLRFEEDFCRYSIESLYIINSGNGVGVVQTEEAKAKRARIESLIDQLAVELVGGVPAGYEEFT